MQRRFALWYVVEAEHEFAIATNFILAELARAKLPGTYLGYAAILRVFGETPGGNAEPLVSPK